MNQTWRYSDQGQKKLSQHSPRYTRYNMSFRSSHNQQSFTDFQADKNKKKNENINLLKSKSCDHHAENLPTFTKYSFFPAHSTRHKQYNINRPLGQGLSKNNEVTKWIGVKQIDSVNMNSSLSNRNAFPQRKTKGSDQLIINMLMKYEKHYGRTNQDNSLNPFNSLNKEQEQPIPYHLTKRQKKYKTRIKWFRSKDKTIK